MQTVLSNFSFGLNSKSRSDFEIMKSIMFQIFRFMRIEGKILKNVQGPEADCFSRIKLGKGRDKFQVRG